MLLSCFTRFRRCLLAGEFEVLAAACGWGSGCRTGSADVRVCLLWVTVRFGVGESVLLLSVVQAKLFNSSHGIFLPDVAFVALESRQGVCWWLCSICVTTRHDLGFILWREHGAMPREKVLAGRASLALPVARCSSSFSMAT